MIDPNDLTTNLRAFITNLLVYSGLSRHREEIEWIANETVHNFVESCKKHLKEEVEK